MLKRAELEEYAEAQGFAPEALERVLKLQDVLRVMSESVALEGEWALKGGTALNVYYGNLPRLSVDIDVNLVTSDPLTELKRAAYLDALQRAFNLANCQVRRGPIDYAGGKFRLAYESVFGHAARLEVDISLVERVPLFPLVPRTTVLRSDLYGQPVPCVSLPELIAGKLSALMERGAARDYYDVLRLKEIAEGFEHTPQFRLAFIARLAMTRDNVWERPFEPRLRASDVRSSLEPLLRKEAGDTKRLTDELVAAATTMMTRVLRFSARENDFFRCLTQRADLRPELLTQTRRIQEKLRAQPMLRWKQQNVAKKLGIEIPGERVPTGRARTRERDIDE